MELLDFLLTGAVIGSTIFSAFLLCLPSRYVVTAETSKKSVQILILGDIGRSPRMQYHALSIAKNGGAVQIIGYQGQELTPLYIGSES
jgi:beta-1,4-mannosyltransferase